MINQDEMRARFHALGKQRAEIDAKAEPVRSRYNTIRDEAEALRLKMRPLLDELQAIEKPLFDIDQERSMITRALAGRTGEAG